MAQVFETKRIKIEDIKPGGVCLWDGCEQTHDGALPPDWVRLLTFWTPHPNVDQTIGEIVMGPFSEWDAVLCPEHRKALSALMKDTGYRMDKTAGTA